MRRTLLSALAALPLGLWAASPAVADRPDEYTVQTSDTITDVNPCTGELQDVTLDVTYHVREREGHQVVRGTRRLTTSGGYSGGGRSSYVETDRVARFHASDMLTDDAGRRIRANLVFVFDVATESVRVDRFELECVRS